MVVTGNMGIVALVDPCDFFVHFQEVSLAGVELIDSCVLFVVLDDILHELVVIVVHRGC